jgi:hypothetical protein
VIGPASRFRMGETRVGPLPNGCVRLGENASKEHSRGLQPAGAGNDGARGVDAVQLHWHYTGEHCSLLLVPLATKTKTIIIP